MTGEPLAALVGGRVRLTAPCRMCGGATANITAFDERSSEAALTCTGCGRCVTKLRAPMLRYIAAAWRRGASITIKPSD